MCLSLVTFMYGIVNTNTFSHICRLGKFTHPAGILCRVAPSSVVQSRYLCALCPAAGRVNPFEAGDFIFQVARWCGCCFSTARRFRQRQRQRQRRRRRLEAGWLDLSELSGITLKGTMCWLQWRPIAMCPQSSVKFSVPRAWLNRLEASLIQH